MVDTRLGPLDLGQAVRRALRADVGFEAYTITSANTRAVFDLEAARSDLGYTPVLNSETYRDSVPNGPSTLCHSGRS